MTFFQAFPDRQWVLLYAETVARALPFVLPVLAATALLALGATLLGLRRASRARELRGRRILTFVGMLLALALIGVALLTPPRQLPGSPPAAGTWLFVPAVQTYQALAVILHAGAAVLGVLLAWIAPVLSLLLGEGGTAPSQRVWGRSALILVPTVGWSMAFLVIAWELGNWPQWFLVGSEFLFAYLVAVLIGNALRVPWGTRPLGTVRWRRRYWQATNIARNTLTFAFFALVLATHPRPAEVIALLALLLTLSLLDEITAGVYAWGSAKPGEALRLSPRRWLATVPLVLVVTTLGALGVFGLVGVLGAAQGYTDTVWLTGGSAAAVYLVVSALVFTTPRVRPDGTPTGGSTAEKPAWARPRRRGVRAMGAVVRAVRRVRVRAVVVLGIGLVAYVVAVEHPDFAPALSSGEAPLVSGAVLALLALPAVVRRGPKRGHLLALLALLVAAMGVVALVDVLPGMGTSVVASALAGLGVVPPQGSLPMAQRIAGEVVWLLGLGAAAFALDLVALPRGEVGAEADANEHVALGHLWLLHAPADAPTRNQRDTLRAIDAFRLATEIDGTSIAAWSSYAHALHRMGIILSDAEDPAGALEHYQQALAAYARVEALDPQDARMLSNHAETLREMARIKQAQAHQLGQQIRERYDILTRRQESTTAVDGSQLGTSDAAVRHLRADTVTRLGMLNRSLAEMDAQFREADALCGRSLTLLAQQSSAQDGPARVPRGRASALAEERRQQNRQYALLTRGRILYDWAQAHLATAGQAAEPAEEVSHLEERALAAVQGALQIGPDVQALNIKGILLQRQGNPRQAAATFEQAFEVSGRSNAIVAHNLGNAWEDAGEWEKAQQAYEQALALRPAYPEARAGRDRMRDRRALPPRPGNGTGKDAPDREPHGGPA